jgi:hypothetical protein
VHCFAELSAGSQKLSKVRYLAPDRRTPRLDCCCWSSDHCQHHRLISTPTARGIPDPRSPRVILLCVALLLSSLRFLPSARTPAPVSFVLDIPNCARPCSSYTAAMATYTFKWCVFRFPHPVIRGCAIRPASSSLVVWPACLKAVQQRRTLRTPGDGCCDASTASRARMARTDIGILELTLRPRRAAGPSRPTRCT